MMNTLNAGLVLEGGGLRGNYTAGVLDAFLQEGIEFPYVIGVSAGCGMGCSYVSRQRGRNLEILKKCRPNWRYLSLRSYLLTGNYFGLDFIYDDIPHRLVPFDLQTFLASPVRFLSVCTDCDRGEPVYYDKSEDVLTHMKASSALPYFSRMVTYQGRNHLDGAITDAIPLRRAEADGYAYNVVVLTRPAGYVRKKEFSPARLCYHRYPRLVEKLRTHTERYNEALRYVESQQQAGRAFVIRPSEDLGVKRMDSNMARLIRTYELGVRDGTAAAARIKTMAKELCG